METGRCLGLTRRDDRAAWGTGVGRDRWGCGCGCRRPRTSTPRAGGLPAGETASVPLQTTGCAAHALGPAAGTDGEGDLGPGGGRPLHHEPEPEFDQSPAGPPAPRGDAPGPGPARGAPATRGPRRTSQVRLSRGAVQLGLALPHQEFDGHRMLCGQSPHTPSPTGTGQCDQPDFARCESAEGGQPVHRGGVAAPRAGPGTSATPAGAGVGAEPPAERVGLRDGRPHGIDGVGEDAGGTRLSGLCNTRPRLDVVACTPTAPRPGRRGGSTGTPVRPRGR
jgi:hypothetical protein